MAATPVLLSFAPSVLGVKSSTMPVTARSRSGSAAMRPTTHRMRRKTSGRKAMIWKRVATATASTHHLLKRQAMGRYGARGVE